MATDHEQLKTVVREAIDRHESQALLANEIGVSPGTISKWKRGRNLSRSQLALVALIVRACSNTERQAA